MQFSVRSLVLMGLMFLSAGLAAQFRPDVLMADERPAIDLEHMVPSSFGDWREQPTTAQIINPQTRQMLEEVYSQTLTRTYANSRGYMIMLSIAYGRNQKDSLQLHKPEICYPAQGFTLLTNQKGTVTLGSTTIQATRLSTRLNFRQEPVTYWTVVGDHVTTSDINKKLIEMRYALHNRIPDGVLVRVSSIDGDTQNAFENQNRFASQMITAMAPAYRERFTGNGAGATPVPQLH